MEKNKTQYNNATIILFISRKVSFCILQPYFTDGTHTPMAPMPVTWTQTDRFSGSEQIGKKLIDLYKKSNHLIGTFPLNGL